MAIEIHKVSTEDGNSHHTARDQPTVPRFLTDSGLGLSLQLGFQPQFPCLGPWCFVRTLHQESQPGIKTARRNINNLRYADDTNTTLMAESEEKLKSLVSGSRLNSSPLEAKNPSVFSSVNNNISKGLMLKLKLILWPPDAKN